MSDEVKVVDARPDRSKSYAPPKPILDRIIVRKLPVDSASGWTELDKFKQPSRRGEVTAVGDCVLLGNDCCPLTDFVNVGDIVTFGEHVAEELSPGLGDGLYVIRIHEVRTVEKLLDSGK